MLLHHIQQPLKEIPKYILTSVTSPSIVNSDTQRLETMLLTGRFPVFTLHISMLSHTPMSNCVAKCEAKRTEKLRASYLADIDL